MLATQTQTAPRKRAPWSDRSWLRAKLLEQVRTGKVKTSTDATQQNRDTAPGAVYQALSSLVRTGEIVTVGRGTGRVYRAVSGTKDPSDAMSVDHYLALRNRQKAAVLAYVNENEESSPADVTRAIDLDPRRARVLLVELLTEGAVRQVRRGSYSPILTLASGAPAVRTPRDETTPGWRCGTGDRLDCARYDGCANDWLSGPFGKTGSDARCPRQCSGFAPVDRRADLVQIATDRKPAEVIW